MTTSKDFSLFMAHRCAGIKIKSWPDFLSEVNKYEKFSDDENNQFRFCKFGYRARTCRSPMCPRCYLRRLWRLLTNLHRGISQREVKRLVIDCDDRIEPFGKSKRLESKAYTNTPVDWQHYDVKDFADRLHMYAVREQKIMLDNSHLIKPDPLGVLSFWTVWPRLNGWFITRVRFIAYGSRKCKPLDLVQPRYGQPIERRYTYDDLSEESLYLILQACLKQLPTLNFTDPAIIPASSLLLRTKFNVRQQHSTGIFCRPRFYLKKDL